jgi:hypothetical protein
MIMNKCPAALFSALLALAGTTAATAQVAYIPPGPQPRFGGEFALSEPGPVAGYWPTQCRVLRIRTQSHRSGPAAPPQVDAALKRFVSGLIAQRPNYEDMTPAMAASVRSHLDTYWPSLNRMGQATVNKKVDTDQAGNDVYVVDQTGGRTHWNMTVDRQGRIDAAMFCQGTGV